MKPRVLIVDDDESVRIDLRKTLDRAGFQATMASDCLSGWALFEGTSFQLVVLDLGMPNFEGKYSEEAGIDFLIRVKGLENKTKAETPVVILTGGATLQIAKKALNLGAFSFFEKGEIDKFKESILTDLKEKVAKRTERNFDLVINKSEEIQLSDEQIEVFQELFSDCRTIAISFLVPGYSAAKVFLVGPIRQSGEPLIPFVAKIGDKIQIDNEYRNFKNYVQHKITSGRYPEVIKVCSSGSGKLGGMSLSLIGADWKNMSDLKAFFNARASEDVNDVIGNLFEETFKFWHESKGSKRPLAILETYDYFSDFVKLRAAMDRFFKEYKGHTIIRFEDFGEAFYDPVSSLQIFNESFKSLKINTYVSTIHGDLNVKNILVDAHKACWLLDFQYTGPGHILTDFVELETSIKYGCFDAKSEEFWELEKCLISQSNFREELTFHHGNQNIKKAFDVVKRIREYAYLSVAPTRDMKEYYIGLLYHTLNMLRFPEKVISKEKKKSILLAASLIFDALKEPGMKIGFLGSNAEYAALMHSNENKDEGKFKVLVVDDEAGSLTNTYKALDRTGTYNVTTATDSLGAVKALEESRRNMFDLCIVDLDMPNLGGEASPIAGLDLLQFIRGEYPEVPVIILSSSMDYQVAVSSISRYGAVHYFNKDDIVRNKDRFLSDIEATIKMALKKRLDDLDTDKAIRGFLKTLPDRVPVLEFVEMSFFNKSLNDVGGDLYDFTMLDSESLGLSIGDVSGKGKAAAVLMAKYLTFYRASVTEHQPLPSLLTKLSNFVFEQKTEQSDFITFFFAILDQGNLILRYCNAGHNPPFVVGKDDQITDLEGGGMVLGFLEDQQYVESLTQMVSGDVLVMFTDGFNEAQNSSGEEYGVERFKQSVKANRHLSAQQIKDSVINSFEDFIDTSIESDDRTLVIVKAK